MRNIVITLVLGLFFNSVYSQNVEFKGSNFKDQKDELKAAEEQIEKGDEFLEAGNESFKNFQENTGAFQDAIANYLKAQAFNPNNAELNMKLGNAYLMTPEKGKALAHLEKAKELDKEVSEMLNFYLGMALQISGKYEEAIDAFQEFKKAKVYEEYKKYVLEYIKGCEKAQELIKNHVRCWVDNVENLNTKYDEFGASISADGEYMMFTSNRENGKEKLPNGKYDTDIYSSQLKGENWSNPKSIGAPLNTSENDYLGNLSYDGQRIMISKSKDGNADIYESKLDGTDWSNPELKMSRIPNTEDNEMFSCYEPLDIKIYYVFDGGSGGDKDVFLSGVMVKKDNIWGKGTSAGHQVNTRFHEGSVFVHPDGRTMYFSSQGHNSMGGYDVYKAEFVEGQWTNIQNLGYPINSPYDDYFYSETANGKFAYITSNRPGGKGGLDIYKVTYWGPEKPVAVDGEDLLLSSLAEPVKDFSLAAPKKVDKKSLTVFKGKVIDAITRKPMAAKIEIVDNSNGNVISEFISNSATGKFLLSLPSGKNYGISVKQEGYLFHSENFNIPELSEYNMVEKTIELKNIAVGSKIALRNVFFETGKSDVTKDSDPELERLVGLLKDVPSLKIELSGHTDNTGSEKLNLELSQARAEAVVAQLVKKGISKSRLEAKGYGSSEPVDTNNTAQGRQNNRRTEFKIIAN